MASSIGSTDESFLLYSTITGHYQRSKIQVLVRTAFVVASMYVHRLLASFVLFTRILFKNLMSSIVEKCSLGALMQTSGTLIADCFVASDLGAYETFPEHFHAGLLVKDLFSPRTVVCSSDFDAALEKAKQNDQ